MPFWQYIPVGGQGEREPPDDGWLPGAGFFSEGASCQNSRHPKFSLPAVNWAAFLKMCLT